MASNDARRVKVDQMQEKRAPNPSEESGWESLSKYLQQCWDQARGFEYQQLLKGMTGSTPVQSSDVGNLQIWDGPRRC